jgi:hypothetical protein
MDLVDRRRSEFSSDSAHRRDVEVDAMFLNARLQIEATTGKSSYSSDSGYHNLISEFEICQLVLHWFQDRLG